jgi:hypothetical protein
MRTLRLQNGFNVLASKQGNALAAMLIAQLLQYCPSGPFRLLCKITESI